MSDRRGGLGRSLLIWGVVMAVGCDNHLPAPTSPPAVANDDPVAGAEPAESPSAPDEGFGVMLHRIEMPERSYIYKYFDSCIILSDSELDAFIEGISADHLSPHQADFIRAAKADFRKAIVDAPIDYEADSLLLVQKTMGSGSIRVWVETPRIVGDELVFQVKNDHPASGTKDMAFHCFAYVVPRRLAKSIRVVGAHTSPRHVVDDKGAMRLRPGISGDLVFPVALPITSGVPE